MKVGDGLNTYCVHLSLHVPSPKGNWIATMVTWPIKDSPAIS